MSWVYNLDTPNAPTNAPRMIAIVSVFSIAALMAVLLRFYARVFTNRKPGIDDYTALVSVVCVLTTRGLNDRIDANIALVDCVLWPGYRS